jgi:hypothetical protein
MSKHCCLLFCSYLGALVSGFAFVLSGAQDERSADFHTGTANCDGGELWGPHAGAINESAFAKFGGLMDLHVKVTFCIKHSSSGRFLW